MWSSTSRITGRMVSERAGEVKACFVRGHKDDMGAFRR